ncbi:MAG: hypothetical protein WBD53_16465 [Xanthobacteraceae bacterium]
MILGAVIVGAVVLMAQKPDQETDQPIDKASDAKSSDAKSSEVMAPALARVRLLMLISGVTTAIAIAAVLGVIGYRVYHAGGSGAAAIVNGTVFLPKGAHVVSTTIGDGHIIVTLDVNGASEVRIYDLKTLQQTGTLRFATAP